MKIFITDLKKIINRRDFISAHLSDIMPADYQRSQNIKDENRLLQFLAGRLLLEKYLDEEFTIESGKVIPQKNFVSLAHSGDYVVLAVDEKPVGIDIEKIDQTRDFQKIAARMRFGVCKTAKDFCKKWTAYEADFKFGRRDKKPLHRFFEHDGFMICVSSLRRKEIKLIEVLF